MDFTAQMMQLQKQLDIPYHEDSFLRDQLLTAVDIPGIQTSLRDRIPRTSEQAVNRIENRLSEKKEAAGRTVNNMEASFEPDSDVNKESHTSAMYYIGQSYYGEVKRNVRTPW